LHPRDILPAERTAKYWHIKLPAFLAIDSQPFDPYTWTPPENDIPDENVIRWRWLKDESGAYRRQANARILRWDDGSMSMQIGGEVFDVTAHRDTSGQGGQSMTYLVADHVYCGLLETQTRITGTMALTPTTIHSKAHRKLASAVSKKHQKSTKTQMAMLEHDPEFKAQKRLEEEREKEKEARKAQRAEGRSTGRRAKGSLRSRRLDMDEDEDDEDMDMPEHDAPIGDFIEEDETEDEGEGARGMEVDEAAPDEVDRLDRFGAFCRLPVDATYAEIAEAAARKERKKAGAAPAPTVTTRPMETDQPEITAVNKRRLVIEDSDDE
jgi:RNA polymerase-associated protein LEO1